MIDTENNSECNNIQMEKNTGNSIRANPLYNINKMTTSSYNGYNPKQIKKAYKFNRFSKGKGQTIAIVAPFNHPNIENDLCVFNNEFNLPKVDLEIVYAAGGQPPMNPAWALQTSLAVEWVHALAPKAKILLVLAASNTYYDLFHAVDVAASYDPQAVTMNWGGAEFSTQCMFDHHFQHEGTVFLAGSGTIYATYPAASPYVLAAGGTTLKLNKSGKRIEPEIAWSRSGGGTSLFAPIPSWQNTFGIPGDRRSIPDVSFLADPNTGVWVYSSIPYDGNTGWYILGGTGLGISAWAALIALTNQKRRSSITNCSELLYTIAGKTSYSIPQRYFYDITEGSNGIYNATEGYDYVTGLGSPVAKRLIRKLHRLK